MILARVLDILLALTLLVAIGEGVRNGIARTLGPVVGVIVGGLLAYLATPLLAGIVPDSVWRVVVVVVVALGLLGGGHALGRRIGDAIRDRRDGDLAVLSRLTGGAANGVVAALVIALVAGGVGALGVPTFTRMIAESYVIRGIDTLTPAPVDGVLARIRATVLEEGLPAIGEALGGVVDSPGVPDDVAVDTDPLAEASRSVVRIGGTAFACGQNQTGTGFVIAAQRVLTNAHVVAGVDSPIVESRDGQVLESRVVYLDPADDVAVLAVDGLTAPTLELAPDLRPGDSAVVQGYPYGGPFTPGPAEVLAVSIEQIGDIYGDSASPREVYTLAAIVRPGNSGGPLLTLEGRVAGVVFARNADDAELGYAMTGDEIAAVVAGASDLRSAVPSGACVQN